METNKIDTIVRDLLQSRTIQPSESSWERLSNQLDIVDQPKKINWFKYAGYAASILLLISVGFFINTTDDLDPIDKNDIVVAPIIDTTKLITPNFKNVDPIETVIVQTENPTKEKKVNVEKNQQNTVVTKRKFPEFKVPAIVKENSRIVIATNTIQPKQIIDKRIKIDSDALLLAVTKTVDKNEFPTKVTIPESLKKQLTQGRIQVDSNALLYAVTNPTKDINQYYKKYNIDRNDVLKSIQNQLQNANLKIDANTLLVDVEKTIDEETFKKSFLQVVKGKVTGFASAFANRNN